MSLSDYEAGAAIAVTDMARAREFYEDKLGLADGVDIPDGGRNYRCGATTVHVFPTEVEFSATGATVLGWSVDDVDTEVDELTARGVVFEQYDNPPMVTDARGVAKMGDVKIAYLKDPDGNVLSLNSGM